MLHSSLSHNQCIQFYSSPEAPFQHLLRVTRKFFCTPLQLINEHSKWDKLLAIFCVVFLHYFFDNIVFYSERFSNRRWNHVEYLHHIYTNAFLFIIEKTAFLQPRIKYAEGTKTLILTILQVRLYTKCLIKKNPNVLQNYSFFIGHFYQHYQENYFDH